LRILLSLGLQRIGVGSAFVYVVPGAIVWIGLLMTGAHPSLAGVVLGLMTPVFSVPMRERPVELLSRVSEELRNGEGGDTGHTGQLVRELRRANRELLPPVVRVQAALHPWVAFGVMPVFALANAGVSMEGVTLSAGGANLVMLGVAIALVLGKPIGIISATWLALRLGWCRMPPGLTFGGVYLVGLLAGIGFTMAIFVAMLAFKDANLLAAAKLGVLIGSLVSATAGLAWGLIYVRRLQAQGAGA
jgi:NhaA family Na+:H+ antiporter